MGLFYEPLSTEGFIRIFLAVFFTFIALFYGLRLLRSKRKKPLTFIGEFGSAHFWGHITFRMFRIAIWAACVLRVFYQEVDNYLGILGGLTVVEINLLGITLMLSGFALVVYAHRSLGRAWHSGIDASERVMIEQSISEHSSESDNIGEVAAQLVTDGIYSKSRNPIFIGVLFGQFGFFLALPSLFSAVCFIAGVLAILNQVKLEEQHLSVLWNSRYQRYQQRVPRWL
ncbi:MAG: methyltransferase [Kangiellaceae bacterium]|jgi:hypothetical protein|nr:methyltransferase [Kangiellaceae bacterium]